MSDRDFLTSFTRNRVLYLDRDGLINVNHGYLHFTDNFDFMDGIFTLALAVHAKHYKLDDVTNQAGFAAGVDCNILLADTAPVKLHDTIYQRVTSLGDTLHFLMCGQSRVIAQ
jgi:histidinol phosphatase-like enzyme